MTFLGSINPVSFDSVSHLGIAGRISNLSKLPSYVQLPKKNIKLILTGGLIFLPGLSRILSILLAPGLKTGWANAQPYGKSTFLIPIRSRGDFGYKNLYFGAVITQIV